MLMERQLDHPGGGKRRAFPSCGILTGFLILILPYVTSPQRRTVFQVSHSVSASSAPYRLNDALNRNISDMESVLLLRRRKGIDGLEISRSAARRATTRCAAIWRMDLTPCCRKKGGTCPSP